jgi:hypothetical protein
MGLEQFAGDDLDLGSGHVCRVDSERDAVDGVAGSEALRRPGIMAVDLDDCADDSRFAKKPDSSACRLIPRV